jgi:cytochrome subunit of sulfide dehydrogenase
LPTGWPARSPYGNSASFVAAPDVIGILGGRFLEETAMKLSVIGAWCAAAALAAPAAPAWAQDAAHVRSLAATCFTCHGNEGRSVGGIPPSLAGRDRGELLQALKDFKSGQRSATIMHQHAKGYTDQQLESIAAYFASVKPMPASAGPAARGGY